MRACVCTSAGLHPSRPVCLCPSSCRLLGEKRKELGEQVSKLRNGLYKIDDTREKVQAMSVELEEAKVKVADFQRQCEEYLVVIVQQKREADEQQKVGMRRRPNSVDPRRSE